MLEKDLNRDLTKLIGKGGWSYKIPDPDQRAILFAGKRPFDIIAYTKEYGAIYIESKLMKNKLQAFSLNRVEEHQYKHLLRLKELGAFTIVVLGIWISRKVYKIYAFDPKVLYDLREQGIKSIKAKQLQLLDDLGYTIDIRSKVSVFFEITQLEEKLITKDVICKV